MRRAVRLLRKSPLLVWNQVRGRTLTHTKPLRRRWKALRGWWKALGRPPAIRDLEDFFDSMEGHHCRCPVCRNGWTP